MRLELEAELLENRGYGDELRKLLTRFSGESGDEAALPADDGVRDVASGALERVRAAGATSGARGSAAREAGPDDGAERRGAAAGVGHSIAPNIPSPKWLPYPSANGPRTILGNSISMSAPLESGCSSRLFERNR